MLRKFHDIEQNSDEWFDLRKEKITSSNFDKIYANYGKPFGNPAIQYAQKKALERVTKEVEPQGYKSAAMQRGTDLEPLARMVYQEETFNEVLNGGFMEFGNLGDSNDGNVGKVGCVEFKCVIPNTHWSRLLKGGYDTSYKMQIQGHLYIGDKEWCDFVQYCPEFPSHKQLYIKRVYKDETLQTQLIERLEQFEIKIQEFVKIIEL